MQWCVITSQTNATNQGARYITKILEQFFFLIFTSVNSISSIPSPVYQCRKALRLNIAVNCSLILLNSSWILVLFPMKVADILSPRGGMSHAAVFTLFGIHSTKYVLKKKNVQDSFLGRIKMLCFSHLHVYLLLSLWTFLKSKYTVIDLKCRKALKSFRNF